MTDELNALRRGLRTLAEQRYGMPALICNLTPGDGHAGCVYLFDIRVGARPAIRCVVKLAPQGVARRGAADVFRQVELLRELARNELPVPDVLMASADETQLGAPFVVMSRLNGSTYKHWDPGPHWARSTAQAERFWRAAAGALPAFHRAPWWGLLSDQDGPDTALDTLSAWRPTYLKSPEPKWIAAAEALEQRLLRTLPAADASPIGLVHGDYQPGNILFAQDRVTGVIDWDLARVGPVLLDIGWLMMMSDQTAWSTAFNAPPAPDAEHLRAVYEESMGRSFPAIDWFRALAGFRMGAIACLNVRLHRSGRRVDPLWDVIAKAVPELFDNAMRRLDEARL